MKKFFMSFGLLYLSFGSAMATMHKEADFNFSPLQIVDSVCFIRADSLLPVGSVSCNGLDNKCACETQPNGLHDCMVMVGSPGAGKSSASCNITINYTNGEHDTIYHDENGSDYDSPSPEIVAKHITTGFANKVCPDGFNDCAYWTIKSK